MWQCCHAPDTCVARLGHRTPKAINQRPAVWLFREDWPCFDCRDGRDTTSLDVGHRPSLASELEPDCSLLRWPVNNLDRPKTWRRIPFLRVLHGRRLPPQAWISASQHSDSHCTRNSKHSRGFGVGQARPAGPPQPPPPPPRYLNPQSSTPSPSQSCIHPSAPPSACYCQKSFLRSMSPAL